MAFGAPSAKVRALRCLARREHSRSELERKLARQVEDQPGCSARAQIDAALDELEAHGLLSDARYAEALLAGRGRRLGVRRLGASLQAKGLEPDLIAGALQTARATELERARQIWGRRFGCAPTNPTERARQFRFLMGRGFEPELAAKVIATAGRSANEDGAREATQWNAERACDGARDQAEDEPADA